MPDPIHVCLFVVAAGFLAKKVLKAQHMRNHTDAKVQGTVKEVWDRQYMRLER